MAPTDLGRLLSALPVSIEAAQLVTNSGKAGGLLLRCTAVLAAILSTTPYPIHQPFASPVRAGAAPPPVVGRGGMY